MSIGLLGKKIGMSQIFHHNGEVIPITILQMGPCIITQIKKTLSDGYEAIQIGYMESHPQKLTKPELGHLDKAGAPPIKHLIEYRVKSLDNFHEGQIITVKELKIGTLIKVSGLSIGKGFSGYHKRHNFSRGPMTHGSKNHKKPGSIGAGTTPGRVFPGKKMAGQMGNRKTTIKNLQVIDIEPENNIVIVKGSVPGKPGSLVSINDK